MIPRLNLIQSFNTLLLAVASFALGGLTTAKADTAPTIYVQPASQGVISGQTAYFYVVANGTEPFRFQWRKNGINLAAATNSTLTISNVQPATAGNYSVTIQNSAGKVVSSNAVLTVYVISRVVTQPVSKTVVAGANVTFTVATTGTAPIDYQWNRDNSDIPGATRASFTITNAQPADAGVYRVVLHNPAGSVSSSNAVLVVNVRPAITSQPQPFSVILGSAATFTVEATGTGPLRYQWRKSGINIAGATNATFTIPITVSTSGGNYSVLVSNAAGSVASSNSLLTVIIPPHITTQPVSKSVTAGANVTFLVAATGTPRLQYMWLRNGNEIPDATNASLTISNVQPDHQGTYSVIVFNDAGSAPSSGAVLTVNVPPVFSSQPQSQTVTVGDPVTFSVTGTATDPVRFQWRKNGVNIAGATNQYYTITNVLLSSAGNYSVVVSNPAGTVTSSNAVLTVRPAPTPGAIDFTVSPSQIIETYTGSIDLIITNLSNGDTVRVEEFLDRNDNGTLETSDTMVQSFLVTDGSVVSFGGIRDSNVPGDEDLSINGQIDARFSFLAGDAFCRGAGRHFIRVSSPGGHFDPVVHTLIVAQQQNLQQVQGKVLSGGTAVPFALTALLTRRGEDMEFVSGAQADASGNYSLVCTSGTYVVFAVKSGFTFNQDTAPSVTVGPGQIINTNLTLIAGARTLSGRVTDAGTGAGIPGVQIFLKSSNDLITVAFTGSNGNYSALVSPGLWKMDSGDSGIARHGYLRPGKKPTVTVGASDVGNFNVQLTRETAVIYGTLRTTQGVPLPNISLFASTSEQDSPDANALTDANGHYSFGVVAGMWNIGSDSSSGLDGYGLVNTNVTVVAGQAALVDLTARAFTAHLTGRVVDGNGNGISGIGIGASDNSNGGGGSINFIQTGNDGSFDVSLFAGSWNLQLESSAAADRGLISPYLSYITYDGTTISNISFVALTANAHITGKVKSNANVPLANVNVWASTEINGVSYMSNVSSDSLGNFSLPVVPRTWYLGVDCGSVQSLGFSCPDAQPVTVNSGTVTANIVVSP